MPQEREAEQRRDGGRKPGPFGMTKDLFLRRAARTIAAVPMTAAVPAAAVIAASLRAIRLPATARCPLRAASSSDSASALV
jgi:hypothetical protein